MGRSVLGWVSIWALVGLLVAGCGDESTAAGGSGSAGTGGNTGDLFPCTEQGIRDAIAQGGGPHTFDCDGSTTVMTQGEIIIDNDVKLNGEGNLTLDGNEDHRVFVVAEGVTAELHGFTVTRGAAAWPDSGGGISNHGQLILVNNIVRENVAKDDFDCCKGPRFNGGGGVFNGGTLMLVNSTVSENAAFSGGGIWNSVALTLVGSAMSGNTAGDGGGGIFNAPGGELTMTNSTVSGNAAGRGGGGINNSVNGEMTISNSTVSGNAAFNGGGVYNDLGPLEIAGSTVSGNSADRAGGGIFNDHGGELTITNSIVRENAADGTDDCPNPNPCPGGGGGIFNLGELTTKNSTVSGNTSASGGGGISNRGITFTLVNATVSGNTASQGGAMSSSGNGPATVANSVVDGDCAGDITSNGYNIESPGDTCGFNQHSVSAEDLKLGPLADNGGPTMTHALLPGSVAIDVIPAEECVDADGEPLTTDQRGEPRPGGTMCDVGSFEVQEGSL